MRPPRPSFHVVDYAVFGAALLLSLSVGIYHAFKARKQTSNKEYLVGNRQFSLIPVSISIVVTFVSGVGLLGNPAEIYAFGTQYFVHIFGILLGNIMAMYLLVPIFYPHKFTSCYEYLGLRYQSAATQVLCNVVMLVCQMFFNGVGVVAPSLALTAVTGIPVWMVIIICGSVATVYTCFGGMKAVIWTDVVQAFFMFAGLIALTAMGVASVGSLNDVWEYNEMWNRIKFFDMTPDPTQRLTFWSVVFGVAINDFCRCAVQASVQRFCSMPSQKLAKTSLMLNGIGLSIAGFLMCLVGMVAFAYYAQKGCDPLKGGPLKNPNQILPFFALDVLKYPGLAGLFVACIVCAALSTSSSSMNATAAMIWQDLLSKALPTKDMSEATKMKISKALVLIVGSVSVGTAFLIRNIKGTFVSILLSVVGAMMGPATGLFVLGAVNPKAGSKAAMVALILALCFNGWLNVGARMYGTHVTPLPSPTNTCRPIMPVSDSTTNMTQPGIYSEFIPDELHINSSSMANTMHIETESHKQTSTWQRMLSYLFSISYLYFPAMGIFIVVAVGTLLSLIQSFQHKEYVADDLLFPCTAYVRSLVSPPTEIELKTFENETPLLEVKDVKKDVKNSVDYIRKQTL